jgi:hypothetical protein
VDTFRGKKQLQHPLLQWDSREFKVSHVVSGKNNVYFNHLTLRVLGLRCRRHWFAEYIQVVVIVGVAYHTALSGSPSDVGTMRTIFLGVGCGRSSRPNAILCCDVVTSSVVVVVVVVVVLE